MTPAQLVRPSCVVITAFAPIPSQGGSHMRCASTVSALALAFDVRVICLDTRPKLIQEGIDFCRQQGIEFLHDPNAFGIAKSKRLSMALIDLLGSLSPKIESISVRRLPQKTVKTLHGADLVWLFRQAPFRYRSFPRRLTAPVIFDVDDIEERVIAGSDNRPKWFRALKSRKTYHTRNRLLEIADVSLLCSSLDVRRLKTSHRTNVLPNTYPASTDTQTLGQPRSPRAVMIGLMDYFPNRNGMEWFLNDIWDQVRQQVASASLTIAGRRSDDLFETDDRRNVDVIGEFDDPAPILAQASVVIVPLRHGSGTRVKILEALAYGRPVVSTTIGAEGLDLVDGESILIADDPETFARHVVRLFEDLEYATRIADAGHAVFLAKYSPEVFTKKVLEITRDALRS